MSDDIFGERETALAVGDHKEVESPHRLTASLSAIRDSLLNPDPYTKLVAYETMANLANAYTSIDPAILEKAGKGEKFLTILGTHPSPFDITSALVVLEEILGIQDLETQEKVRELIAHHLMLSVRFPDRAPAITSLPLEVSLIEVLKNIIPGIKGGWTAERFIASIEFVFIISLSRFFSPNLIREAKAAEKISPPTTRIGKMVPARFRKSTLAQITISNIKKAAEFLCTDGQIVSVAPPGIEMIGKWHTGVFSIYNLVITDIIKELQTLQEPVSLRQAIEAIQDAQYDNALLAGLADRLPNIAFISSALFPNQVLMRMMTGKSLVLPGFGIFMGPNQLEIIEIIRNFKIDPSITDENEFSKAVAAHFKVTLSNVFASKQIDWIMQYIPNCSDSKRQQRRIFKTLTGWIGLLGNDTVLAKSDIERLGGFAQNIGVDLRKIKRFRPILKRSIEQEQ